MSLSGSVKITPKITVWTILGVMTPCMPIYLKNHSLVTLVLFQFVIKAFTINLSFLDF